MKSEAPLAVRMHPRALDEFAGQVNIAEPGNLTCRTTEAERLFSERSC